ncbi:hypothetical protein L9F63_009298, partial [Diploptera punctata]
GSNPALISSIFLLKHVCEHLLIFLTLPFARNFSSHAIMAFHQVHVLYILS